MLVSLGLLDSLYSHMNHLSAYGLFIQAMNTSILEILLIHALKLVSKRTQPFSLTGIDQFPQFKDFSILLATLARIVEDWVVKMILYCMYRFFFSKFAFFERIVS